MACAKTSGLNDPFSITLKPLFFFGGRFLFPSILFNPVTIGRMIK